MGTEVPPGLGLSSGAVIAEPQSIAKTAEHSGAAAVLATEHQRIYGGPQEGGQANEMGPCYEDRLQRVGLLQSWG